MPVETIVFWSVCMFSGFIWGVSLLLKIENSGVERWGAGTGSIFKMEQE